MKNFDSALTWDEQQTQLYWFQNLPMSRSNLYEGISKTRGNKGAPINQSHCKHALLSLQALPKSRSSLYDSLLQDKGIQIGTKSQIHNRRSGQYILKPRTRLAKVEPQGIEQAVQDKQEEERRQDGQEVDRHHAVVGDVL